MSLSPTAPTYAALVSGVWLSWALSHEAAGARPEALGVGASPRSPCRMGARLLGWLSWASKAHPHARRVSGQRGTGQPTLLAGILARSWVQGHPPSLLKDADLSGIGRWAGAGLGDLAQHGVLHQRLQKLLYCPTAAPEATDSLKSVIPPPEHSLPQGSSGALGNFWVWPEVTALLLPWTPSLPPRPAPRSAVWSPPRPLNCRPGPALCNRPICRSPRHFPPVRFLCRHSSGSGYEFRSCRSAPLITPFLPPVTGLFPAPLC